jgi:hypothetical protein
LIYKIFSNQDLSLNLIVFLLKEKKFKDKQDENTQGKNHIVAKKFFLNIDFFFRLSTLGT